MRAKACCDTLNQMTFPALLPNTSGLQLPGTAFANRPGTIRTLAERSLAWRHLASNRTRPGAEETCRRATLAPDDQMSESRVSLGEPMLGA